MNRLYRIQLLLPLLSFFLIAAVVLPKPVDDTHMTVHEWGTFTSVAGDDGNAIEWRTYSGPADLPCFVYSFGGIKGNLSGSVRMETPVLYFYSSRNSAANVKVRFPKGTITEWYPKESGSRTPNSIEWRNIQIAPDARPDFPEEYRPSHYYAARLTDAAPLQVGLQKEKFIFYRGIGTFPLPISAQVTADGKILVKKLGTETVEGLILFDNHEGKSGYEYVGGLQKEITLDLESLQSNRAGLLMDLERVLVNQGLYQREARAMIETWRDSWFEEGARLFYVVPRHTIDAVVPLNIEPAPAQIERVFVGRMELITPAMQEVVRQAIAKNDQATLQKYGRFLEPIAKRIGAGGALLDSIYSAYVAGRQNCK
jgi:hypothetical protein